MKIRICSVALIEKDGKILMGNKKPGVGPYPDTWRLPGGGIEEGESPEDALKREIMEEIGVNVTDLKFIGLYEDDEPDKDNVMTHYVFHMFKIKVDGEGSISDELTQIKWIDKSSLNEFPLPRPSIKLFKELGYV